ncbi:MAG: hypothetical protein J6Q53_04965 [Oscillospiraceae bacterium]|nr:hypothetical protein [Oscillospiraceae bacterium]
MTDTDNLDIFRHNNRVYGIRICINSKKFRKLCQERRWFEGLFSHTYEEVLQMADACRSFNDLMILANHIEFSSRDRHTSNIADWILSDCCHFAVYEMEPLPKNRQCKLKICQYFSRFKRK